MLHTKILTIEETKHDNINSLLFLPLCGQFKLKCHALLKVYVYLLVKTNDIDSVLHTIILPIEETKQDT